jgi:hypothetical protein
MPETCECAYANDSNASVLVPDESGSVTMFDICLQGIKNSPKDDQNKLPVNR